MKPQVSRAILEVLLKHLLKAVPVVGPFFELGFDLVIAVRREMEKELGRPVTTEELKDAIHDPTYKDTVNSFLRSKEATQATTLLTENERSDLRQRLFNLPSKFDQLLNVEDAKKTIDAYYLSRAPDHLVFGRAVSRAAVATVILLVAALVAMFFAYYEDSKIFSGETKNFVGRTVSIPVFGLLLATILTFATAVWIDPKARMFWVIILLPLALITLAVFTDGYVACLWEIPQWGPAIGVPWLLLAALLLGGIYALVGTERFGAIVVLLAVLLVSVWSTLSVKDSEETAIHTCALIKALRNAYD